MFIWGQIINLLQGAGDFEVVPVLAAWKIIFSNRDVGYNIYAVPRLKCPVAGWQHVHISVMEGSLRYKDSLFGRRMLGNSFHVVFLENKIVGLDENAPEVGNMTTIKAY